MAEIEPVQVVKARRDAALAKLVETIPYVQFLGVSFDRLGDELTAKMKYDDMLIGNPTIPAIHGGVTGAFCEIAAIMQLAWDQVWDLMEAGGPSAEAIARGEFPKVPKTVDITIDYLRSGKPRDAYARAIVAKRGRRVANVRVEAWQDERMRPFASAHGHFLLPEPEG